MEEQKKKIHEVAEAKLRRYLWLTLAKEMATQPWALRSQGFCQEWLFGYVYGVASADCPSLPSPHRPSLNEVAASLDLLKRGFSAESLSWAARQVDSVLARHQELSAISSNAPEYISNKRQRSESALQRSAVVQKRRLVEDVSALPLHEDPETSSADSSAILHQVHISDQHEK